MRKKFVRVLGSDKLRDLKGKLSASSWRKLRDKLHEIFGKGTIRVLAVRTRGGYWILDLLGERSGSVAIKDGEIVSYGVLEENKRGDLLERERLYIKHKDREYQMTFGVGTYIIMEFCFIGSVITPLVISKFKGETVTFPEFDKTYNGNMAVVWDGWGCINVSVFDFDDYLRAYVLLPNGESFLLYEEPNCYVYDPYLSPLFYKVGKVFLVGVDHKMVAGERKRKGWFIEMPGHYYVYFTQTPDGRVYVSFDLRNWANVGEGAMMAFKDCRAELSGKYLFFQGGRDVCP